jgi:ParB family chromosome partitioning protein
MSSRLGRGLSDILGEVSQAYEREISAKSSVDDIYELDIDNIVANPHQPRRSFSGDSLQELCESIKLHGILQPVIVKKTDEGFMLLAGERRLRASKLAGLETIKAIITDIEFDKFRELALIENIQREDLNPLEVAISLKNLIEEHNLTHEELAARVKKSRTQITNTLRLLSLSDYVQEKLLEKDLSFGHAKVLIGLDTDTQKIVVDTIIGQKLSVRDSEVLVKEIKNPKNRKKSAPGGQKGTQIVDLKKYKQRLKNDIPLRFEIKKNKLEISFDSEAEIETFLKYFKSE